MRERIWSAVRVVLVLGFGVVVSCCRPAGETTGSTAVADDPERDRIVARIVEAARLEKPLFEDTKRARNELLAEVFEEWVQHRGGKADAETISEFHTLLGENGLTTFVDFLAAETAPVRRVTDPASGDEIAIFGALGTDVINPWLAAVEVIEGKPLGEQPNYQLACDALREHIDFALVGTPDPNLSLEMVPEELRPNVRWAYGRLNPTHEFEGGFDHVLFYASVREAAKKTFRQDYPAAKITMADVVVPVDQGGFGIGSCLLCHDRSHEGICKRLLGQHLHLDREASAAGEQGASQAELQAEADVFLRAAETVVSTYPELVDISRVRTELATPSDQDVSRLKPGFDGFQAALADHGCLDCHMDGVEVPSERDPATYDAITLRPSTYYKASNIRGVLALVSIDDVGESRLLHKATGQVGHKGPTLDAQAAEQLHEALETWLEAPSPDLLTWVGRQMTQLPPRIA